DPDNGVRLWATDGSYTGTWALEDLVPGPASMYPGGIWPDGTFPTAFIATNSENENVELYSVPVGPSGYMQVPLAGCPGASTICSVKSDPNYISYVWAVTNGNISSGQGTNTISLLPDASGTMSISCQITDQFGAMVDIQRSVPIYNEIPAPASVTGPSIVCANRADLVFSVDPVPGAVGYQWAVPPGVSVKNFGPNAQSILVDWGTNGGAVTVSTITACGTSTPASLSVSVVSNAVVANAGADLAACGQIQLQANLPPSGSGTWSVVSGPNRLLSQIFEPNNPTSIFSPNLVGTYVLRWTISNACGTTCDDVQVSVSSPPTALAGPDDTALNGMPYPLGGNSPAPYTGMWSVVNGPSLSNSQFSSPSSPTSTFSADGGPGVYVLRWTIFAGCGAFFDDVALTVLGSADLELTAIVPDPNMRLAEVREFEIHLINQGPDAATASVSIGILPGARVTDIVAVNGTVAGNGLWQIPSFTGTATAFVSVRMDGPDPLAPVLFLGQVWTSDLPDPDSTPGNSQVEDDLFSMLLVPYDEVYFPDPNLRNAVINDPNIDVVDDDIITQSEAQLVTSLSVHGQNIADLTGVSAMENLTYLGASFNQITDLPDLTNLGQLVTLEISENRIASLYNFYLYLPTSIQNLFLSGNQLSEINTDLVNLVDLQALDLSSNPISTVPDIFLAFPNLQHIWLSGMGFTELPPSFFLATNLQTIVLSRNPIGNIPDLSMFPGLSLLGLDKTKMDLLPHLATNANLTVFSASGNRLENVTELVLNSSLLTNAGHFVDVSNNFLSPDDCPEITQLDARVQTSGASFLYENQGNGHVLAPEFPNWPFQPNTLMNWVQDISNEIYLYHLTCP
ncbi:MAG: hypothetical protein KDC71_23305, partial [Acidobacteria bacterium]|nr:hypothetical protein [Acidobacteriota bacterium]